MFVIYCLPTGIHAQQTALKTNTLFWATTTPNVGVEFGITRQITLDLWGAYNAWKFSNDMKLNMYLFQPEVRYWICRSSKDILSVYTDIGDISTSGKYLLYPD